MVTGTICYAHIIYSQVTGYGGPILVIEHHSGAHRSYSIAMMDSVLSSLWCCIKESTTLKISIYNIPSYWVIHKSLSGYMDRYGWHKSMSYFPSMCCSSPLNPLVLLYDGHESHFDDRELYILHIHNLQSFIIKAGDYIHEQTKNIGPNMKLNIFYGNARMNWTKKINCLCCTEA